MRKKLVVCGMAATLALLLAGPPAAVAQQLWAPKGTSKYTTPHKPRTRLADLKARHKGRADWRELIVDDEHLRGEYISSGPGRRTARVLHPDTRTWWVVMEGQVRFEIEGQAPFVASRRSIVQVPMATIYSWETIGDEPSLVFETRIAGAKTIYAADSEPPRTPGFNWLPVRFNGRKPGVYGRNNKPHTRFEELAGALEEGRLKGTQRVVEDDRGAANFIYGYEKNLPPLNPNDRGHYHPESSEYWLILAGQIRYRIENAGVIIAEEGDVVYVPKFTWHLPRWYGPGPSCRLAMNGYPNIAHLFDPELSKAVGK